MGCDITFMDCPAELDDRGEAACGLPAEIRYRYVAESTSGPLASAMIRCPVGHWFNGPLEFLIPPDTPRVTGSGAGWAVRGRSAPK